MSKDQQSIATGRRRRSRRPSGKVGSSGRLTSRQPVGTIETYTTTDPQPFGLPPLTGGLRHARRGYAPLTYEDMIMNELRHIAEIIDSINEKLDELQRSHDG